MSDVLKRFNKIFNIQTDINDERAGFVQKINQTVFKDIEKRFDYKDIFRLVSYRFNINSDDRINRASRSSIVADRLTIPKLRTITNDDFCNTLKLLILLYEFLKSQKHEKEEEITNWIIIATETSQVDLGIRWQGGMFYPSSAKKLDEALIDDILGVLDSEDKKEIFVAFKKGLKEFMESTKSKDKLQNVVRDMQLSLDETAKILLKEKNVGFKHLLKAKNWDKIIDNKYYQKIFFQLNEFADKLVKHKSTELDKYEVETFIYLTGIFLRLVFINK